MFKQIIQFQMTIVLVALSANSISSHNQSTFIINIEHIFIADQIIC